MSLPNAQPKKHWGQHFLTDKNTSQAIVDLLQDLETYPTILEIGPGKGALTQYLIKKAPNTLSLVEIDPEMVSYLHHHYPTLKEKIIHEDFLSYPLEKVAEAPIALISNLPYNVGSQILLHAVNHCEKIPQIVCMLQKEVAQRIASGPNSKKYGILSVWFQAFYHVTYALEVPPEAFSPPPKIDSAVLRMQCYRTTLPCNHKAFFSVLKAAFHQRRKILANTLRSSGYAIEKTPEEFQKKRAEQLSIDDFITLTQALTQP